MGKVYFLLCIHNHQPVGNFESVMEEAYNKAYKPFIDIVKEYPDFKFTLHCSGILWDFFTEKHPEYIEIVKELVNKGQVELISAGYYEPILCSIPQRDRIGQIKMANEFIYKTFGIVPKGLWLTERIWEQSVVKDIVDTGIEYTLVDDHIFYTAGVNKSENPYLTDYYLTEEEGRILYVFPILQTLRYYIPFKPVKEVIELFYKFYKKDTQEVVGLTMGDDGEKFGIWPKTYEHVYTNGWLKEFVENVLENNEWLQTATLSEFIKLKPPKQRIYLPTASYFEMGEWCLPVNTQTLFENLIKNIDSIPQKEVVQQFVHGGYWKNFFAKYPESNNMHKKMLYVSELVKKSKDENLKKTFYKSQCNCAYWHGVFGGLYLTHLRDAIYSHLINVEKQLVKPSVYINDYDKDSFNEIAIQSKKLAVYIKPSYGGSIYEIDLKDYDKNLLNVISRKREAYHERLIRFENNKAAAYTGEVKTIHDLVMVKEEGLSKKLYYDWHLRYSFLDHFLPPETKFEDYYKSKYIDQGDFTIESYNIESVNKKKFEVKLSRTGHIRINNLIYNLKVDKTYKLVDDSVIKCVYNIENLSETTLNLWFLTEINMLVFHPEKEVVKELYTDVYRITDTTKNFAVEIKLPQQSLFWIYPIETISLSEAGFERVYQGTSIAVSFKFTLNSKQSYTNEVTLEIK